MASPQYEAGLTYSGQSGALNESVSDVFGSLVKQRVLGHDAASGRLADRRRLRRHPSWLRRCDR